MVDSEVTEKYEGEIKDNVEFVQIRAEETALGLDNYVVVNMVLLKALAKRSGLITLDDLKEAVRIGMNHRYNRSISGRWTQATPRPRRPHMKLITLRREYPKTPIAVVRAVIFSGKNLLLVRRRNE